MEINTFGTQFVTLFPWSNKVSNGTSLTFEIVNASENETATIIIEYDIGLGHFKSMAELSKDVIHVASNSFITHKFDPTTVMTRPLKDDRSSVISVGATRIFISSNLSISIIECIFITRRNGDCFTVLPVTMAGNHYSFSIATFMGISTAYFIPTYTDSYINITTITRESFKRVNRTNRISRFDHGSMIYAYNNSINDSFTVHITSSSPIVILLAIRTQLTDISSESFACTMLMPLPDNVYSRIALRDDFDVHFTPLQSFENCQTHLFLSPPMQSCQTFTVATFRPNSTKLINVEPCNIFDNIVMQWNYHFKDAIIGYASNNTLFQLLRFETYQNLYSFLDMIPAYSQYLTGRMCFPFKNESEQLFLYDISRQQDSIVLDGKVIDAEYVQYFENSFRSITMRKINTTKLERGMHCLESNGRYLLFIFGGNRRNYGYAYAFNAYPTETLKWTMKNDANLYHQDIFGVSFITLFPWMIDENATDNFNTDLSLDILNPHPYMFARVRISYYNGSKGNLTEILYNIKPYTHHKLKMNKIMMTKLYNAYNVSIYKSYYDSRITITSTIPISVTQSCFIGNRIGDSFTVLPLKMAGQNYSFSLPKSVANNSHSIVYLLPSFQTTKISFIAKVDGEEKLYNIKTKAAKNSSIFAYYGSAEEVSMNLWSDKSFQVIIALQRLLIIHNTEHRLDFGCTMAVPMPSQSVCSMENDMSLHDMHYMFIAQHYNYSGFFTMTPSDSKCSAYYVDFFPRKKSTVKEIKRLKFEPATMQHYFQLSGQIFSDFSTMYCR
ncbi:Uncharacterized protein BM_BM9105 [Brugia malayi]|nr:Uncharacterized protein BM_BM9105 [Brugia malayi]VIO95094.1 Uncharacterized protein BM_BM9105 [Brugia malayi]